MPDAAMEDGMRPRNKVTEDVYTKQDYSVHKRSTIIQRHLDELEERKSEAQVRWHQAQHECQKAILEMADLTSMIVAIEGIRS